MSAFIEMVFSQFIVDYLIEIDGSMYLLADGWFESLCTSMVVCLSSLSLFIHVIVSGSFLTFVSIYLGCKRLGIGSFKKKKQQD